MANYDMMHTRIPRSPRFLCSLAALFGLLHGLIAQSPYQLRDTDPVLEPWRWDKQIFLDGESLTRMTEAPDGTLWLGGIDRIIRYDGQTIDRYSISADLMPGLPFEIRLPSVKALYVTPQNRVLININNRLFEFADEALHPVFKFPYSAGVSNTFYPANEGWTWLKTERSIWKISPDLKQVNLHFQLPRMARIEASMISSGDFWLYLYEPSGDITFAKAEVFEGKLEPRENWETIPVPTQSPSRHASILASQDGFLYFADSNSNNVIQRYNPETDKWRPVQTPAHSQSHYYLYEDSRGMLWAMGAGEMVRINKTKGRVYYPYQVPLPRKRLSIVETSQNQLWILSGSGKALILDVSDNQWETIPDLHLQAESEDGTRWFTSQDKKVISHQPDSDLWLIHDNLETVIDFSTHLFHTPEDAIWAVGQHQGVPAVSVYYKGSWTRRLFPEFAAHFTDDASAVDADGKIWLGSFLHGANESKAGYLKIELAPDGTIELLNHYKPPAVHAWVSHMEVTRGNTLWLADSQLRTMNIHGQETAWFDEFPQVATRDLEVDAFDNIWIAKGGYGVWQFIKDKWVQHSSIAGLESGAVSNLLPLQNGDMLAASEGGVSRFDGSIWSPHVFHPSIHLSDSSYSGGMKQGRDGSIYFNFNSADWQRRGRDSSGRHTEYSSVRYSPEKTPPETHFNDYLELVSHHGNTHINWGGHDRWNRTDSEQLQFSWKLNDGSWSTFSPANSHTFLDLPSGEHILEVRARDNDFNVDPTPAQITFKVELPPWLQWSTLVPTFAVLILGIHFFGYVIFNRERRLRERNERALERQRHLEEMDQLKAGYVNNISHELNTPLSAILLTIKKLVGREEDPRKHQRLSLIQRNAEHIKNLISQLLLFRQLEQDTLTVKPEPGDLRTVVAEEIESLNSLAEVHQISLHLQEPENLPGQAVFDHDLVRRVIENFISNAIKYNFSGGQVTFTWDLKHRDSKALFSFTVEDNGRGIPEKHLEHIFDRFYRVEENSLIDGSGIGLNLTKKIISELDGTVQVTSPTSTDPDRPGTRIFVEIPIQIEPALIPS
ncbi:MAG: ATP-binding protein [Opitutales bacterium]